MFKVKALHRFSSMMEGNVAKGQVLPNMTRDRAYQLMSAGHVEILEGDSQSSNFETHDEAASSLPLDPLRSAPSEARNRGVIGQPSRSTTAGALTTGQPPSTPPTGDGGASETRPDSATSTSSGSSSEGSSGHAMQAQRASTSSTSSKSKGAKGSARKKG